VSINTSKKASKKVSKKAGLLFFIPSRENTRKEENIKGLKYDHFSHVFPHFDKDLLFS
jgi:hypothetical protein